MSKWCLFLASFLFILPLTFAQQKYLLTDIGSFGGDCGGYPRGINSKGEVVGQMDVSHTACLDTNYHPFYWSKSTGLIDLGLDSSSAAGINRSGIVVGSTSNGLGQPQGFSWTKNGGIHFLRGGPANAVNDSGQVVGYILPLGSSNHAYRLKGAMYKDLGTLPGGQRSVAFATNTAGQVVGWSALNSRDIDGHAFLWQEGRGMTDLGVLPGDTFSRAYAINTSGQIIGISIDSETLYDRAFLWTKNAGMEQISTTPDFATAYTSAANGINDSGQIVGSAANNNGPFHAFIWTKSSGMQDLNLMITTNSRWVLEEAIAINNAGQIACYGYLTSDPDRRSRPFLLTPVN